MNDMNEKVSSLMDSALEGSERARLFETMAGDVELRRTWHRYHLIGATLKNELGRTADPALAERIAERIAGQPAASGRARHAPFTLRSVSRQAASLALAASVAALAIFTLAPEEQSATAERQAQAVAADPGARVARAGSTRWETLPPEMESTLNAYLVEHGEFAMSPGLNGLTSYARFVSYDAGQ